MEKKKILININNLANLEEYRKIGFTNFLFAVEDFSIGYQAFPLDKIPKDAYLFLNRVMDSKTIDYLKEVKEDILKYRGIIFEDLGVYNIFKDEDISLIWFQNHFGTNSNSINYYLDHGCDSAVIANELCSDEIKAIITSAHKPLVFNVLGKNNIMYSRRKLLSNYNEYMHLDDYNDVTLETNKNRFFARESEYGTCLFNDEYFNYINFAKELDDDKIKFYLILNMDLYPDNIQNILDGSSFGDEGFLNKKTVYRLEDYDR